MSDHVQARTIRWRNVILGGASAGLARALAMFCSLVQVPLALRLLGPEVFGLWVTLQAAAGFVAMLDLGTGYRLQNHVAHSAAVGRLGEARRDVRMVVKITIAIGLLFAVLAWLAGERFWTQVLGVTEAVQRGNPDTHLAGLVALCCGLLPANLGLRLASGLQRQWVVGTSQAIVSLLTLLLTVLCVGLEVAPRWFLAGSLALPILINGGLLAILWRRLPAESPDADRPAIRHWLREGLPFFVPQLSASLRANGPSFIIASVLGAAAVTPYNLIQRVLNFVTQPQNWLLDPLWSGITDAASRADYTWIRSVLRLLLVLSTVCTVLPLLSMLGWGPWFVQWWTGFAASNLPGGLLAWLVAAQVGIVLIQPFTICLNGLGWMRGQMIYGTITSVLSLGAMAVLCPRWGLATALAPTAILLLGFNLPCAWWDVRQVMRRWTPEGKNA